MLKKAYFPAAGAAVLVVCYIIGVYVSGVLNAVEAFAYKSFRGDFTLVIDAGHGGADGGAVSLTGVRESAINLEISRRLECIAAFYGIPTVMTRTGEEIEYPGSADTIREKKVADQKARVRLINSVDNAVLISIHQNKYTSSEPRGAQALFGRADGSEGFSEVLQSFFKSTLDEKNRRAASRIPSGIYLFDKIDCPSVLVECGFLSNSVEASLLITDEYQIKLAAAVAAAYIASEDLLREAYGGAYES